MPRSLLLTGPSFPALESRAFDILSDDIGGQPESLLYIADHNHPEDVTEERWTGVGPPAALRVDTFDGFVSDCYEHDQFEGPVTHIDRPLLLRLIELGIERIESRSNPLHPGNRFPTAGLIEEAETLFTDLEFAGLHSPEAKRRRLEAEDLPHHATAVGEFAERIDDVRTELLGDGLSETYRSERMRHVTKHSLDLDGAFSAVDAVVLGGLTRFDVLQRDLLDRIADNWPTVALVSLQSSPDEGVTTGIDEGAHRALETYRRLGFDREFHTASESPSTERRRRVTGSLYRHPERSADTTDVGATDLDLTLVEPETVPEEIRTTARDVRCRLGNGVQPGDIGVVLPSPVQYVDQVREVFEQYDLPFSVRAEIPLSETVLGDVITTISQLAQPPRDMDALLGLLTNPLVDTAHVDGRLDHRHLSRVEARAETARLESTLEHADEAVAATVESLLDEMSALADTSLDALPDRLDALLERLGAAAALDGERELSTTLRARGVSARDRLDRVLETLALTAPVVDATIGDSLDRLERAIDGSSIRMGGAPDGGRVVVCGLGETLGREFERVYLLGLTSTHFPSDVELPAFTRPIYESHPDFEQVDSSTVARYRFGTVLGSEASLQCSVPQRSLEGDPYFEADVLTELRRVVDLATVTEEPDAPAGTAEDVQRDIGSVLGKTTPDHARELVEAAVASGTFDGVQQTRIEAGIACSAARSCPELTPYDGQLTAETVSLVHGGDAREPYSPSRLETYAACGFKYYMRRTLGIEAPDPIRREPDAGDRGTYVHDVLEHYYRSLQSTDGDPVHPRGDFETRQERLLEVALDRLEDAFENYAETGFQAEWLTGVLAGLGDPETNDYYGPVGEPREDRPPARGLFHRFLEHEFEEPGKTTARPTWFEARVGTPHDAGTPLQEEPALIDTPEGTVPIHGLIDRVETVPGTDPTQIVVRDYKTGRNVPGETDALLGTKFQLPLYALMAEDALDGVETVGGAYYQVAPPASVNSRSGLLTSQEMAVYHGSDDVETPLLRYSHPHFETHDAFRRFVETVTPRRLGTLAEGIAAGRFHPTVLDPSDAGCRYCDYADVCDVRPHRRHDVVGAIADGDTSAYVPPGARGQDPTDVVEVE